MRAKLVFAAIIAAVTASLLAVPELTRATPSDAYAVASASS